MTTRKTPRTSSTTALATIPPSQTHEQWFEDLDPDSIADPDAEELTTGQAQKIVREIVREPVGYVKGILGHKVWHKQQQILQSVAANGRTAVKACHASSKTFTAAEIALWWITYYKDGICITTAPVFKQVRLVMWGEIHRMARNARLIEYPKLNQTELRISEDNYLIGISTDAGVNVQGFHGRILIILDEAVGIANDIHEAIEGIRAGGDVRILALGNPTVPGGWFYDAFDARAVGWNTITISAFDSPNISNIEPTVKCTFQVPGVSSPRHRDILATLLAMTEEEQHDNGWPFLTTRQWVVEKWYEWGRSANPLWWSRVLGLFPPQADNALISSEWVEQARWRDGKEDRNGRRDDGMALVDVGIDVAGPGEDETVVAIRRVDNGKLLDLWTWNDADPRPGVTQLITEWAHRTRCIRVDSNGIGYGLFLHIADHMEKWPGVQVIGVNVGAGAYEKDRFQNLKAELCWHLREVFELGFISGIEDETLRAQCLAILYKIRVDGKIQIESKDEMMKRGVKSPDRFEALMLAFAPIFASEDGDVVYLDDEVTISPV